MPEAGRLVGREWKGLSAGEKKVRVIASSLVVRHKLTIVAALRRCPETRSSKISSRDEDSREQRVTSTAKAIEAA